MNKDIKCEDCYYSSTNCLLSKHKSKCDNYFSKSKAIEIASKMKLDPSSLCYSCSNWMNNCSNSNESICPDPLLAALHIKKSCSSYLNKEQTFSKIESNCSKCICNDKKDNKCIITFGSTLPENNINTGNVKFCKYFVEEYSVKGKKTAKKENNKIYSRFSLMDFDE